MHLGWASSKCPGITVSSIKAWTTLHLPNKARLLFKSAEIAALRTFGECETVSGYSWSRRFLEVMRGLTGSWNANHDLTYNDQPAHWLIEQQEKARVHICCIREKCVTITNTTCAISLQLGMHLCVAGWLEGQQVGYPTRFPSPKCGNNHVGVVTYKSPVALNSTFDAYCYRIQGRQEDISPNSPHFQSH